MGFLLIELSIAIHFEDILLQPTAFTLLNFEYFFAFISTTLIFWRQWMLQEEEADAEQVFS